MVKLLSTTLIAGFAVFGGACVDPQGAFDDFQGRVIDATPVDNTDSAPLGELPDINGRFLVGFAAITAPTLPVAFEADVTFTDNGDGTGVVDMQMQPLHAQTLLPVGDVVPQVEPAVVANSGRFSAPYNRGAIPGPANPITGGAITVTVTFEGTIKSKDLFCGPANGDVVAPTAFSIDNSTFAGVRIPDGAAPGDEEYPELIGECPPDEPDVDAGVPDAGLPDAGLPDAGLLDAGMTL